MQEVLWPGVMSATTRAALILGSMALVAGGAVAYPGLHDRGEPADAAQTPRTASATVNRGDLVVSEEINGTLGYTGKHTIVTGSAGTLTSRASNGVIVSRGQELFSVNGRTVRLLYGSTPAYRTLSIGSKGRDVFQLESNLLALGYGSGWSADNTYTAYTATVVQRWQKDIGRTATGEVELGDVIFYKRAVRISGHASDVGATLSPGQAVLETTDDEIVVSIDLPVDKRPLARKGSRVKITLPGGRQVTGRIRSIGTVAQASAGGDDDTPTVKVIVSLDKPKDAEDLDAAPVKVRFESERRRNVLSVPVNALIALPSGEYAVIRFSDQRALTVKLGVFADGRVEVSGKGLREGIRVEVPAP